MSIPKVKGVPRVQIVRWNNTTEKHEVWDGAVTATITTDDSGLSGASTDGSETLTAANTWVQVPGTIPTNDYVLSVSREAAAGTVRWSFDSSGVPSATNGNRFPANGEFFLGGGNAVFFGSTDASDVVNWTAKETA